MDIGRRLIGSSALVSGGKVIDVDLGGLVRRLLLFDKYVLTSVRLQEFPILARRLGYGPLKDLLDARLIEIRCESLQLTQIGQSGLFGDPILPLFSYKFNWIDAHDRYKYIHDCLQAMHESSGLRHNEIVRIKRSIVGSIKPLPFEIKTSLFAPFRNELLNNDPLVRRSIELSIKKSHGVKTSVPFSLKVREDAEDRYTVETNLANQLKVEPAEAHKIVEAGLLALSALTQAIGEMKAYFAISGFRDEELPLFRDKLDFLADAVSSSSKESTFQKVITIAGLPELPSRGDGINTEKLLSARESSEVREFRDWLTTIGTASDADIREHVSGIRNSVGLFLGKQSVKDVKALVLSAASCIPHPVISLPATAAGILDHFLVEKVFPRSGIAAFVNELYPSIFEKREDVGSSIVREMDNRKQNSAVNGT
jgi:hypothetical protein